MIKSTLGCKPYRTVRKRSRSGCRCPRRPGRVRIVEGFTRSRSTSGEHHVTRYERSHPRPGGSQLVACSSRTRPPDSSRRPTVHRRDPPSNGAPSLALLAFDETTLGAAAVRIASSTRSHAPTTIDGAGMAESRRVSAHPISCHHVHGRVPRPRTGPHGARSRGAGHLDAFSARRWPSCECATAPSTPSSSRDAASCLGAIGRPAPGVWRVVRCANSNPNPKLQSQPLPTSKSQK